MATVDDALVLSREIFEIDALIEAKENATSTLRQELGDLQVRRAIKIKALDGLLLPASRVNQQALISNFLNKRPGQLFTADDLANLLKMNQNSVRVAVSALLRNGEIGSPERGKYTGTTIKTAESEGYLHEARARELEPEEEEDDVPF